MIATRAILRVLLLKPEKLLVRALSSAAGKETIAGPLKPEKPLNPKCRLMESKNAGDASEVNNNIPVAHF